MTTDIDCALTIHQWETLRALRPAGTATVALNQQIVEQLIALDLATIADGRPAITARGRKVMLRGSPSLWDVAA